MQTPAYRAAVVMALALAVFAAFSTPALADGRLVVNTTSDTATGCVGVEAECSLRAAIELANAGDLSGEVEIEVEAQGTIEIGAGGELVLAPPAGVSALSIVGPGAGLLTIDGQHETRAFRIEGGQIAISGLTVENARKEGFTLGTAGGAALYQEGGTVTLAEVTLRSNSIGEGRNGGAIDLRGGELTIEDSLLEDNETGTSVTGDGGGGGAIYQEVGPTELLTVTDSVLKGNRAREAGGIYQDEGSLLVRNTLVEGGEAEFAAGGIYADAGSELATTLIERTRIVGNKSEGTGGGLVSHNAESEATVVESTIDRNESTGYGAGVSVESPTTISQSTISRNVSSSEAGGIQVGFDFLRLFDSTVAANTGIGIVADGSTEIVGSTIVDNGETGVFAGEMLPALTSTILAGNGIQLSSPSDCGGDAASDGGGVVSGGGNVVEHPGVCEFTAVRDQAPADPQLGSLADNGGPTETVAPVSLNSAAINHGLQPSLSDQRGLTRPVPAGAENTDAGAVEVQLPTAEPSDPPAISPSSGLTVGATLTCSPGGWNTDTVLDPSLDYSWQLEEQQVATGSTYELVSSDAGKELVCEVTADNGAGQRTASSAAVELPPAEASLAPASLSFAARNVGSGPSEAQTLTLSNSGGADLQVTGVSSDDPQFPLDASTCPATLAPGAHCAIAVRFAPTAVGAQAATVTAQTNGGEPAAALSGLATEPALGVSPTFFDFGEHRLDAGLSNGALFTVSNEGDGPMTFGDATIGGTGASQFQIPPSYDGCATATLLPGEECFIEVFFDPDQLGAAAATLEINGNAPGSVPLSGTGVAPAFSASPASWDFEAHGVDAGPSVPREIVVTNAGTASMQIGQVTLQGADPSSFQILPGEDCSQATLAPDADCSVEVSFDPGATGPASATLSFPGDAAGTVQLEGTGVAAERTIAQAPQPDPPAPQGLVALEGPAGVRVDPDGGLPLRLSCGPAGATPCQVQLTVAAARGGPAGPLATWSGTIAAGAGIEISPQLSRTARSALGERGRLPLLVTAAGDGGGSTARIVARAPKAPALQVRSIRAAGSALRLVLACSSPASGCRGSVRIAESGKAGPTVASGRVSTAAGKGSARVPLTGFGRRLLEAEPTARLTAIATALDPVFARSTVRVSHLPSPR